MELIPGLPDDIAVQCLIRVPYQDFPSISSVCRRWKALLQLPHFFNHRKLSRVSQQVIIMAQPRFDPTQRGLNKNWGEANIGLTLFEPQAGIWTELPELPLYDGLLTHSQLATVGHNVILIGGWIHRYCMASPFVFIYNFVSGLWRRGSNMPGPRCSFACASDNRRAVFVAGGTNGKNNALRSALTYDVEKDEWTPLADMARARGACKGFFNQGKFYVISGFEPKNRRGTFERSAEVFDVEKWGWDKMEEDFLKVVVTDYWSYVIGGDGKTYMYLSGKVVTWGECEGELQVIADVPKEVSCSPLIIELGGNLLVMGSQSFGAATEAYVLDLKSSVWAKVEVPIEYSSDEYKSNYCCIEI